MKTHRRNRARWYACAALAALALAAACVAFLRGDQAHDRAAQRPSGHEQREQSSASPRVIRVPVPALGEATLSGTVYGTNAERLAGATVCASCAGCNLYLAESPPSCTRSDRDGKYALTGIRAGDYLVSASAIGYAPGFANGRKPILISEHGEQAIAELDLQLNAGGALVSGVVIDVTGGPVAGAIVQATSGGEDRARPLSAQTATSDEQGRFVLAVQPGHIALLASAEGYAPGFASRTAPASDVEVIVAPSSSIRGLLVTDQGEPVANLRVLAQARGAGMRQALSDDLGRFAISGLPPGSYQLRASGEGWLGDYPGTIALSVADAAEDIVVTVRRAASVRGRLLADDEQPCAHGEVHLGPGARSYSVPVLHAVSNLQGGVEFEAVPPGRYQVTVACAGSGFQPAAALEVGEGDQSGLVWKIRPMLAIDGRVLDDRGRPVERFMLELRSVDTTPVVSRSIAAGPGGAFSFTSLSAGRYSLRSRDLVEPLAVELGERSATGLTLVAKPTGYVELRVTTPQAKPVDGLSISAVAADGRSSDLPEELGNGTYRLGPLPAGSYAVSIGDGINPRVQVGGPSGATVVKGGETTRVELAYGGYRGRISGRVLDETGAPIENVWVQARPSDHRQDPLAQVQQMKVLAESRRAMSDLEGRFELGGLVENAAFVVTAEWPLGGQAQMEGVRAGASVELVLQALGSLAGTAVDAQGQPVAHLSLQISNPQTGQQRMEVSSDPQGRWRIDDVTPGSLQIIANDPNGNVATASWTLAPKQRLEGLRLELQRPPQLARDGVARSAR
jgi:hypothetical protein